MNGKIFLKATRVNEGQPPVLKATISHCLLLPLFTVLIFTAGCLSVEKRLNDPQKKYPRKNPGEIEISFSLPEKKHILLGELSIRYNTGYKRNTALEYLKKAAASEGADGIVLKPIEKSEYDWQISNSSSNSGANFAVKNYEMKAVMYRYLSE